MRKYLTLSNGIPSHDTLERLLKRIESKGFSQLLLQLSRLVRKKEIGDIVNIDGKTVCGSKDETNGKYAIHMVSAWCRKNRLVLGQVKTACKTNEIEAVKALLLLLDIEGAVITADAMSCQKEIAQQIVIQKADYILAVKDNQKNLRQDIVYEFKVQKAIESHQWVEKSHGRIETRTCQVIHHLEELQGKETWAGLKSIIKITSLRNVKGALTEEDRFYISIQKESAHYFNQAVRNHWSIENELHWVLDVQFEEDSCRKRKDNAAENFATIRRIALHKLANTPVKRQGINNSRRIASWNDEYLSPILEN